MQLERNIGKVDMIIRYIVGVLLLALLLVDSPWRWLGLLGLVLIGSAFIKFCPVWRVLRIDTRERKPHSQSMH